MGLRFYKNLENKLKDKIINWDHRSVHMPG